MHLLFQSFDFYFTIDRHGDFENYIDSMEIKCKTDTNWTREWIEQVTKLY